MERLLLQIEKNACNCLAIAIIESREVSDRGLSNFADHLTLEELRIIKQQLVKITSAINKACDSLTGEIL